MSERERALQRDLDARVRLARDPIYLIKQRRSSRHVHPRPEHLRDPLGPVSEHELDTLRCRSRSLTNRMTADTLGISIETVKSQLKSARTKLRAKDTTGACCNALRLGLID